MPAAMPPVDIRTPVPIRIYAAAFVVVWDAIIIWNFVIRTHSAFSLFGVAMGVAGTALGLRILRMRVESRPDATLVVRNGLRTQILAPDQIESFRIEDRGMGRFGSRKVQMLRTDSTTLPLEVTATAGVFDRGRSAKALGQLAAWLDYCRTHQP